jgi:hypothetical protein
MKEHKKKRARGAELDMNLNDALARIIQTDPRELTDAFKRNEERADEIRRAVEERRERLRTALQGPKKQFSI